MITVSNTKELERIYGHDLSKLRDDEEVVIIGGLEGKSKEYKDKYKENKYKIRTTYTGRDIKQIVTQMQLIEKTIPIHWTELQKAKKIHDILGKRIEYDDKDADTQQCSNLTILLSRKGICAGYSLLYKEMMDRQGIECDYIRGYAITYGGGGKHAWNVLHIDGKSIPIDLTWDSPNIRSDVPLKYFGIDTNFEKRHFPDDDERISQFTYLTSRELQEIDVSKERKIHFSENQKDSVFKLGIEETYNKYKNLKGENYGRNQIKNAIKRYIEKSDATGFTRDGNARMQIQQNIDSEEMLDLVVESFVNQFSFNKVNDRRSFGDAVIANAVGNTIEKYNSFQAKTALREYIKSGDLSYFTRENNSRQDMANFSNQSNALDYIVGTVLNREIEMINENQIAREKTIDFARKIYIDEDEFLGVSKPSNNVFKNAILWISQKFKSIKKDDNKNRSNRDSKDNFNR